jgi:hypothetical protein
MPRVHPVFRLVCRGIVAALLVSLCASSARVSAQQATPQSAPQTAPTQSARPALVVWGDTFDGEKLDETKWERFSFEGGSGGKFEVKSGELRQRSMNQTRAGVRSKPTFTSDFFSVEAKIARVGAGLAELGDKAAPLGFAALTILFDGSGRNRVEWVLTSEGTFEAWSVVDGRGERLDNGKLGLKFDRPVLSIVRRGDEYLFVVNKPDGAPQDAQVALTRTIKNLPRTFRLMLYGFGSSENDWDEVRVVTKQ